MLAVVCTLSGHGAPEMTPIWYEYNADDGCIWFNGEQSRQWLQRMAASGRATFFLLDPQNAWRWAQVYGRVVESSADPEASHFKRLGKRYGRPIGSVPNRHYLRIEPTSDK